MQSLRTPCHSLISRLWREAVSQSDIPRPNTLTGLPAELLLSIADFLLLPTDLTCFALCNRRLFALLYARYQTSLPAAGKDSVYLLSRLERDLPAYSLCYACHRLHQYDGSKFFFGHTGSVELAPCYNGSPWPLELKMRLQQPIGFHSWYKFNFADLQLAMRRFRYGPQFGISTECLSYTEVYQFESSSSLFSVDAQICPEPLGLCLRFQNIMLANNQRPDLLFSRPHVRSRAEPPMVWYMCKHTSDIELARFINSAVQAYQCEQNALDPTTVRSTSSCICCGTESLIEVYEDGADLVLALTRWVNLGPGLSPDDRRWKVHSDSWKYNGVRLDPSDLQVTARTCFELASSQPLEDLRSCNLSYLKNERYKGSPFHGVRYLLYSTPRVASAREVSARKISARDIFAQWEGFFVLVFIVLCFVLTILYIGALTSGLVLVLQELKRTDVFIHPY